MKFPCVIRRKFDKQFVRLDDSGIIGHELTKEIYLATIIPTQEMLDSVLAELKKLNASDYPELKRYYDEEFEAVPVKITVTTE